MSEQSDTPRTEMAEGQGLNPYFEGRFDGESDELCALRLTLARERDEARAIANDRDAMVDHRDRALTAMYQRVDVITRERDEARAEVERLRSAFVHCHVRGSSGDLCAACGLDLRDKVHTAATEAKP
jgi:predicted  nucleic acid-binding Zn-ribbon protein